MRIAEIKVRTINVPFVAPIQMSGGVVKPGVIELTERGTMQVPTGLGLGVELDPAGSRRRLRRMPGAARRASTPRAWHGGA